MLKTQTLFGTTNLVEIAKRRMKRYEPPEGYYLAFSGGKDSQTIYHLAVEAGIKFDAHYNVTTIDPPDLVRFIRKNYPDVIWDRPEMPFLPKLATKGFPLRQARWCCELYKERGGKGRIVMAGIRWQESIRRRTWQIETKLKTKTIINPIIDWDDSEVWQFIRSRNIPYCRLYDEGWARLGCLFCPFQSSREKLMQVKRYPQYAKTFIRYFEKLYKKRRLAGAKAIDRWSSGEEMFWWWIGANPGEIMRNKQ